MPLALVTGPCQHLGPAAAALGRAGFEVMTWATGSSAAPGGGSFDCYVQLPCADPGAAPSPRGAASRPESHHGPSGRRAADDLVCRVDALAAVAGRLKPNASILLAVDEVGFPAGAPPGTVQPDLLAAVALALLEDLGLSATRLAVLPMAQLCRRAPAPAPLESLVPAGQWEMPTPPLVSAP